MQESNKPLVIVGDGEFAEIAYEYFTRDSNYRVAGFAVEKEFLKKDSFCGLPVVAFEDVEQHFAPAEHAAFAALVYTQLNRPRTRLYHAFKAKGYAPASYVSSRAFVWHNVTLGEHCFVFENNVLQHHTVVGNNVVLWSGNHIGHRSVIKDNCFVSSHVVVSGYCEIGENCFLGVNSTLGDHVKLAKDCVIGAGAVIVRDTEEGKVYPGPRDAEPAKVGSLRLYKVRE